VNERKIERQRQIAERAEFERASNSAGRKEDSETRGPVAAVCGISGDERSLKASDTDRGWRGSYQMKDVSQHF
jgi:hypothetical protein